MSALRPALLLLLPAAALGAAALPAGQALGDVVLTDLGDRPVALRSYAGMVVVLVHEDRDTRGDENQALKDALGQVGERHRERFRLIAVADVSPYDFWPARRFAKDALRKVAAEGVPVLCDWKGQLRRRLGLRPAASTVIVLAPDGRAALVQRGRHDPREIQAVVGRIEQLLR